MFGPRNRRTSWATRTLVVAGAVGALLLGAASAASADPTVKPATSGSVLSYTSLGVDLYGTTTKDPKTGSVPVAEFSLDIHGTATVAYCVDINHPSDAGHLYDEGDWKDAQAGPGGLGKIQWILTNSFPNVSSLSGLLAKAGASLPAGDTQLEKVVYTGTQAAIWHYSDGFVLDTKTSKGLTAAEFTAVQKLYTSLVDHAVTTAAPPPTLSFTAPSSTSGPVGSKIGPFTVNTTAKSVTLSADHGGKVVDRNGTTVTSLGNGGQFWVQPTQPGTTTVTASGEGTVPTGRAFFAERGHNAFQQIILAGSAPAPVKATVTVTTSTAKASASASGTGAGTLPVTGTSLTWIVIAAVVLLGGGAVLFVLSRRRRTR